MAYITNTEKHVSGTSLYITDAIKQKIGGFDYYTESSQGETLSEQLDNLNNGNLYDGVNNITQTNNDLPFNIDLDYYSSENTYQDVIYSQDDKNDLKIYFNDVELQDADVLCEKITRSARILPDDGAKRFSIDNFVSTSLDIILHNVNLDDIVDQVRVEIGTDIGNNTYEYIPLGVFNIQDTPEKNGNTVTLKLRDNRVKFEFNYNAQPLIESNNGSATKKQIFDDICTQAGVETTIEHFANEDDLIGIYDNTISAHTYISYLMEQAGLIPTIDRQGRLIAVDLSDLYIWKLPLSIIESWEKGEPYDIKRVVYESGIVKYETSSNEELNTLYLNAANPYVSSIEQVQNILTKLQDFEIDSVSVKKALGNPAIDPYDIIEVYNDLDGTNDIVFRTLANTSYTFNGVHRDIFDTQIGKEQRTENVSINEEATFQKYAKTYIDNLNGQVVSVVGEFNTLNKQLYGDEETGTEGDVVALKSQMTQKADSFEFNIYKDKVDAIEDDGAAKVKTSSVTINDEGLNVSTSTSKISTTMTNNSFEIRASGYTNPLAYFGYDENEGISKAEMDNLTVQNYFVAGVHRVEKMEVDGEERTGYFYIGG